ncbi:hypothetical protein J6590_098748 [Homalodisca vitripennis]|nr:hypothetical protein J6590_098748 [Homalodisca vitripennis]
MWSDKNTAGIVGVSMDYSWNCGSEYGLQLELWETTAGIVGVSKNNSWNCGSEYGLQLELWDMYYSWNCGSEYGLQLELWDMDYSCNCGSEYGLQLELWESLCLSGHVSYKNPSPVITPPRPASPLTLPSLACYYMSHKLVITLQHRRSAGMIGANSQTCIVLPATISRTPSPRQPKTHNFAFSIGNVAEKKFGACGRDKIDTGQSDESREIFCSGSLAARLRYSGADLLQDLNSILSRATNSSC